jgi:hypothetical protein
LSPILSLASSMHSEVLFRRLIDLLWGLGGEMGMGRVWLDLGFFSLEEGRGLMEEGMGLMGRE